MACLGKCTQWVVLFVVVVTFLSRAQYIKAEGEAFCLPREQFQIGTASEKRKSRIETTKL